MSPSGPPPRRPSRRGTTVTRAVRLLPVPLAALLFLVALPEAERPVATDAVDPALAAARALQVERLRAVVDQLQTEAVVGVAVDPIDGVVVALQILPIAVIGRRPLLGWGVVATADLLGLLAGRPFPVASGAALLVAAAAVALHHEPRVVAGVGAGSALALVPVLWHPDLGGPVLLTWLGLLVVVLLTAGNVRSRRDAQAALAAAGVERQHEQRHRAVLEERSRIARELHDVVAHHVSLIAVQAQSAPRRIEGLPAEGVADFRAIGATARDALVDMRRLLGVLRNSDEDVERAPQPGLGELPALIAEASDDALTAELVVDGAARAVAVPVGLSAYRIVQESLTNVRRHAGAAHVTVRLRYADDGLAVRVEDDGRGAAAAPGALGHGLLGMQERAAALGGTLSAGPSTGGGFVVDAWLPVRPVDRADGEAGAR